MTQTRLLPLILACALSSACVALTDFDRFHAAEALELDGDAGSDQGDADAPGDGDGDSSTGTGDASTTPGDAAIEPMADAGDGDGDTSTRDAATPPATFDGTWRVTVVTTELATNNSKNCPKFGLGAVNATLTWVMRDTGAVELVSNGSSALLWKLPLKAVRMDGAVTLRDSAKSADAYPVTRTTTITLELTADGFTGTETTNMSSQDIGFPYCTAYREFSARR